MGASGSFLILGWCWVGLHQAADMTWHHGELYNLLAQQSEAGRIHYGQIEILKNQ